MNRVRLVLRLLAVWSLVFAAIYMMWTGKLLSGVRMGSAFAAIVYLITSGQDVAGVGRDSVKGGDE